MFFVGNQNKAFTLEASVAKIELHNLSSDHLIKMVEGNLEGSSDLGTTRDLYDVPSAGPTSSQSAEGSLQMGQDVFKKYPPNITPFSNHFKPSVTDYIMMGLMIPVLPIRIVLSVLCLLVAYLAGKIAIFRNPDQIVNAAPFTGWRAGCREVILWCARGLFFAMGIQRVEFVGSSGMPDRFASSSVAPVLISAPHYSYLDAFISASVNITPVIKASAASAPIFGVFLKTLQPIFVNRDKPESRANSKEAIIKRCSTEKGIWPPLLVFPEGTTGNGQCLYKFKTGAFYPGQPIQIASIEYRSCMSNWNPLIMAWDSSVPVWQSMIFILLQPHITARIHILPIYYPSEEEKKNPHVFAANVQQSVADYLGIPATDYTYENARDYVRSLRVRKRQ